MQERASAVSRAAPCGCVGHRNRHPAVYAGPSPSVGAVGVPITAADVEDLDDQVDRFFADVNRTVAQASGSKLATLAQFQGQVGMFHARWKAWYAQHQETWMTWARRVLVPLHAILVEGQDAEELGALRGEFNSLVSTWTVQLGEKTDAIKPRSSLPWWVWAAGAGVFVIGAAVLLGPALASFIAQHMARKAATKAAAGALAA